MSDGVAAADARPARTVRRALLRTALVGAVVCAPLAAFGSPPVGLAVLSALATVLAGCALVEGWARARGDLPGGWVALAAAVVVPVALLQGLYAQAVLGGAAPGVAFERALAGAPPPIGLAVTGLLGALVLGFAVRLRHGDAEVHGEVLRTLALLSVATFCYAPVILPAVAAAVWGLAGMWSVADRAEAAVWPLVDDHRLADLRLRLADGRLSLARLRAAAWVGDPGARAVLGARAPTPPDELRAWVRGLAAFEVGAAVAAARGAAALVEEERAALRERGEQAASAALLEQALSEAARAVEDGAGGSGHGPVSDAAVRAGWAAAFAADALGEAPVRAWIREAVSAWALEERG